MTAPDLVAAAEEADPLEGAGILSSAADVVSAYRPLATGQRFSAAEAQAAELGLAADVAGSLDALGAVADPLGTFVISPAVGWVIEHVRILKEPFDKLLGDPAQIKANAQTWHNVARRLRGVADEHDTEVDALGWDGAAGDAYRRGARRESAALREAGRCCERLAGTVMGNGALVATVRSVIRDIIVELVTELVEWLAPLVAGAVLTGGAALAPEVALVAARVAAAGRRITALLTKLFAALGAAVRDMGRLARAADELAPALRTAAAGGLPRMTDAVLEAGKQVTKADREQDNWDVPQAAPRVAPEPGRVPPSPGPRAATAGPAPTR